MARRLSLLLSLLFGLLLGSASPLASRAQDATPGVAPLSTGQTIVAGGLTNPRGFAWGADGTLYLASAGRGGETRIPVIEGFTVQLGLTSAILTVAGGCTTPLVQGLVSSLWEEPNWAWGAMDVAFHGDDLYVLISGAGPSWLSPTARSGVFRRNDDGTMTLIADITTWLPQHPPAVVPPDYDADGSLFDLEAAGENLVLSEAVGGQILTVTPNGEISTLADLSEGHPVPAGIAVDADGNVYAGFQTVWPFVDGSSKVVKIAPDGTVSDAWTGLTRITDLVLGPDGMLYAAEASTGNTDSAPYVHPNTGRIVRQTGPDTLEVVAAGLDSPVGLGFDTEGALYVSGPANGANHGEGWLARIDMDGTAPAAAPTADCAAMGTPTA